VEIQKLRSGAASSEYATPPGLKFYWDCGSTNMPRLTALKNGRLHRLCLPGKHPRRAKKTATAKIILGWTIGAIGV
jgi:hypothetical protein